MPIRGIRKAVRHFAQEALGNRDFSEDASLESLGLDKREIMDLIAKLEDEFGLTAFTADEDRLLAQAVTANDLRKFLESLTP
ncbi:acyl carrier protein [Pseudomonas sp. TE3610]